MLTIFSPSASRLLHQVAVPPEICTITDQPVEVSWILQRSTTTNERVSRLPETPLLFTMTAVIKSALVDKYPDGLPVWTYAFMEGLDQLELSKTGDFITTDTKGAS